MAEDHLVLAAQQVVPNQERKPQGPTAETSQPLGAEFEPILKRACAGRLSTIRWFRTDWQRGGALTGYAEYRDDDGTQQPVVVKLPIGPGERLWLLRLQPYRDVVPRVYQAGESLDGYDIVWVVMEQLPHGPLSAKWAGSELDLLIEAAGRFYQAAAEFPIDRDPPQEDWQAVLERSRRNVSTSKLTDDKRWNKALKKAQRKLPQWLAIWAERPVQQWCHGDLHLANAMTRIPPPEGPAILLDFALAHAGCWVEDAVYLEHLYWARRQKLEGRKICQMIARQRKKMGLRVNQDWPSWASVRRALLAMGAPAARRSLADPLHLNAALDVLEAELAST